MTMAKGMTVQPISSASDPWTSAPSSVALRRRKRIMNTTIRPAMSTVKKAVMASRNSVSASTWPATVEACSGMSLNPFNMRYGSQRGPRDCGDAAVRSRRSITNRNVPSASMVSTPPRRTAFSATRLYRPVVGS